MTVTFWQMVVEFLFIIPIEYIFTCLLDDYLRPRYHIRGRKWLYTLVLSVGMLLFSVFIPGTLRTLFNFVLYALYVFVLYNGAIGRRVLLICANVVMLVFAELLSVSSLEHVIDFSVGYEGGSLTMSVVTATTLLYYGFEYLLIRSVRGATSDRLSAGQWVRVALSIIIIALCAFYMFVYSRIISDYIGSMSEGVLEWGMFEPDIMGVILAITLPLVLIMLFSILHGMSESMRSIEISRAEEQRALYQAQDEKLRAANVQHMKTLRRDMAGLLDRIESLSGADGANEQRELIAGLLDGPLKPPALAGSGNSLLDALLGGKRAVMEAEGIESEFEIDAIRGEINMDDASLSSLVTNALDNAIEACLRTPPEMKRWINARLKVKGADVTLRVDNACHDAKAKAGQAWKKSSKRATGAGYGLKTIARVAHRHNGEVALDALDDDAVSLVVYLPRAIASE